MQSNMGMRHSAQEEAPLGVPSTASSTASEAFDTLDTCEVWETLSCGAQDAWLEAADCVDCVIVISGPQANSGCFSAPRGSAGGRDHPTQPSVADQDHLSSAYSLDLPTGGTSTPASRSSRLGL